MTKSCSREQIGLIGYEARREVRRNSYSASQHPEVLNFIAQMENIHDLSAFSPGTKVQTMTSMYLLGFKPGGMQYLREQVCMGNPNISFVIMLFRYGKRSHDAAEEEAAASWGGESSLVPLLQEVSELEAAEAAAAFEQGEEKGAQFIVKHFNSVDNECYQKTYVSLIDLEEGRQSNDYRRHMEFIDYCNSKAAVVNILMKQQLSRIPNCHFINNDAVFLGPHGAVKRHLLSRDGLHLPTMGIWCLLGSILNHVGPSYRDALLVPPAIRKLKPITSTVYPIQGKKLNLKVTKPPQLLPPSKSNPSKPTSQSSWKQ
ncbi:hypothetical protein LSTR_LSTR004295 [Laodelphax striatellus]|uniref:Uncharacterized protein n=1 Tax=Laodelphax striatellus TaxID=195883 RepID=A0A482WHC1_LAOST|nr:hypothetical protein LSTR_LSTR004295 [Laodelphax striatellus]